MYKSGAESRGFALPTVVIASVLMFMILVAAVGSVSSARVALDAQYYQAQLRDAAESGAARASDCLGNSTMTVNVVVTPATNCDGSVVTGRSAYIVNQTNFRTSYDVTLVSSTAQSKQVQINGKIDTLRTSTGTVVKSSTLPLNQNAVMVLDPAGDRPSQRWWYFGTRVIMDFGVTGSAMPTFSYNASSSSPAPTPAEGTTTVTDQNGNLAFWTDGLTIWDKAGNVMQNSTGLNGAQSATQAVASFPMNTARTQYGVVSNSGQGETGYGQLYLSIIDMTLNNGYGAVTTKNQQLGTTTGYSSEALNAMPSPDGTGYYVYTFNPVTAKITYFLVKNDGTVQSFTPVTMSPAPVICATGTGGFAGYGSANFSHDYTKLVLMDGAWGCNGSNGGGASDSGRVYLYDVNTSSGALTFRASWISSGWTNADGTGSHGGYTADFSPQEKYIYVGQIYPGVTTRYDITSGDSTTIKNSEWIVGYDTILADAKYSGAHIRQGPDGRMWIADWEYGYSGTTPCKMGYISAPDSPTNSVSSIGFSPDAVTLPAGACSHWGLPQVATVFKPKVLLY